MTRDAIAQWLIGYLSTLLSIDTPQVDTAMSFDDYGIDSRDAMGLVGDLGDWLDVELETTIIDDYQTIDELSHHLSTIKAQ